MTAASLTPSRTSTPFVRDLRQAACIVPFLLFPPSTGTLPPTRAADVRMANTSTTSLLTTEAELRTAVAPGERAEDTASLVRTLREESGLTWDQLGRFFGVSRRAVHLWANGGGMNSINLEHLHRLLAEVRALPASTSETRRSALLRIGPDGMSALTRLQGGRGTDVSGGYAPEELLGALHDRPST